MSELPIVGRRGLTRKRELKRIIIRLIRNRQMYGYELWKTLESQGDTTQLSYLYKTLKEMCDEGLLESRITHGDGGPDKRQYTLSAKGKRELARIFGEATELIHDFYEEYVATLPPEFFTERFQMMLAEVCKGRDSVALVVSQSLTHLHRNILEGACRRSGAKHTYLVKPTNVTSYPQLANLTILEGDFEDLPLKEQSIDGMIVVDIQDAANLERSCREFRRVMREGGVVFACSPFMGLTGETDPLELGEFMKRTKYDWTGKAYRDREVIRKAFEQNFDYVDVANMALLTGFMAGLKPVRVA